MMMGMSNGTIPVSAMIAAAGDAARVMGAAFGFNSAMIQQRADYMGVGLQLFNSGASMLEVCQLVLGTPAFQAGAGGTLSNDAFVNTVYQNVTGNAPTPAQHAYYVGLLQGNGGVMTQAQLLMHAANTDANAQHIDLAGLQHAGMWWL